jgi:hypothetical protein
MYLKDCEALGFKAGLSLRRQNEVEKLPRLWFGTGQQSDRILNLWVTSFGKCPHHADSGFSLRIRAIDNTEGRFFTCHQGQSRPYILGLSQTRRDCIPDVEIGKGRLPVLPCGPGGNAQIFHLPELGIHGNSHLWMLDKNNLQVGDLILKWIDDNVGKNKVAKN